MTNLLCSIRESHIRFRTAVRKITDELAAEVRQYEITGERPSDELQQKLGTTGLLAANIGPGPHLREFNIKLPGGVTPEEFDYFHEVDRVHYVGALGVEFTLSKLHPPFC